MMAITTNDKLSLTTNETSINIETRIEEKDLVFSTEKITAKQPFYYVKGSLCGVFGIILFYETVENSSSKVHL